MFQALLESAFARRYFSIYLDEIGQGALISFWSAVQEVRQSDKKLHHQLGTEIYYTYLSPNPPPVKVDKVKKINTFILFGIWSFFFLFFFYNHSGRFAVFYYIHSLWIQEIHYSIISV